MFITSSARTLQASSRYTPSFLIPLKSRPTQHLPLHSRFSPRLRSSAIATAINMPPKRRRSTAALAEPAEILPPGMGAPDPILPLTVAATKSSKPTRKPSRRGKVDTNPDHNADIQDGKAALRASPDADEKGEALDMNKAVSKPPTTPAKTNGTKKMPTKKEDSDSPLSDLEPETPAPASGKKPKKTPTKSSVSAKKGADEIKAFIAEQKAKKAAETKIKKEDGEDEWDKRQEPDGDEEGPAEDVDVIKQEASRPPPVNSGYLPLPWKGRLGYACLNTYLRLSNPPIFTSRTCRIASILEHRHPLKDPSQPEHATKNRPDKTQPASEERGKRYVEELCLANVRDIPKMLRWNEKYGIKFLRLSSEMFPFASHAEYGYQLATFASKALAEAGKVAAELGHRLTTHPGQFTQLGSPRAEVINNAIRDLEYHDEMLSLLRLPPQEDRDAVMILHMGGTFGDKAATLERFKENYIKLSPSIKQRLVLENDDVSWSVHNLLPVCEELNIPLCLDFHHHNIIFDSTQLREGTKDIMDLFPRIKATWDRKQIRQKMHHSEPTPQAVTGRQRRKHNPRPATMPPCPNDMDLMIEAKDKEQAVFELMRTFKLPGWDSFNDIVPYERDDDNKPLPKKAKKKKTKKQIATEIEEFGRELSEEDEEVKVVIPEEQIGMGGKENRVYWPVGMEEWLRPRKREVKKKGAANGGGATAEEEEALRNPTPANHALRMAIKERNRKALSDEHKERLKEATNLGQVQALLDEIKAQGQVQNEGEEDEELAKKKAKIKTETPKKKATPAKKKTAKSVPTPSVSMEDEEEDDLSMPDLSAEEDGEAIPKKTNVKPGRQSGRAAGKKRKSYAEDEMDEDE